MRANAHTVRGDSILIGQCWSRGVSQVLTVLIKKENRAQRSRSVSLNQESDTRQDIVERRPDEDHLERVEHSLAGESVRVDGRRYGLIRESRGRSGVCHKKTGRLALRNQYRTKVMVA